MKTYLPTDRVFVIVAALSLVLFASALAAAAAAPPSGAGSVTCPPPGFDSVPDFDVMAYAAAPWYVQRQVRACSDGSRPGREGMQYIPVPHPPDEATECNPILIVPGVV